MKRHAFAVMVALTLPTFSCQEKGSAGLPAVPAKFGPSSDDVARMSVEVAMKTLPRPPGQHEPAQFSLANHFRFVVLVPQLYSPCGAVDARQVPAHAVFDGLSPTDVSDNAVVWEVRADATLLASSLRIRDIRPSDAIWVQVRCGDRDRAVLMVQTGIGEAGRGHLAVLRREARGWRLEQVVDGPVQ